jgi:hypothetical protein
MRGVAGAGLSGAMTELWRRNLATAVGRSGGVPGGGRNLAMPVGRAGGVPGGVTSGVAMSTEKEGRKERRLLLAHCKGLLS